jgi:hypothetical protein
MRTLTFIFIFATLATATLAQNAAETPYKMPRQQNEAWMVRVKKADKIVQLELVKNRLFREHQTANQADDGDVPLLIIDGIAMDKNIDKKKLDFLHANLTADKVDIAIIEKEPKELYVNKRFTGMVLLKIVDRKIRKNFKKLK